MYGIYADIGGILMVNVTIYSIHGSYGYFHVVHEPIFPFFSWGLSPSKTVDGTLDPSIHRSPVTVPLRMEPPR